MREEFKEVTYMPESDESRVFVIKRFTALKGLTIAKKILTATMPTDLLGLIDTEGNFASQIALPKGNREMSDKEFEDLCKSILKEVSEKLPAGNTPILDSVGNYRVSDLEYNMELTIWLLIQVLIFNYSDFFTESLPKLSRQTAAE